MICMVCREEVSQHHITTEGDHRTLPVCWECAVANHKEPDVLFSVPELVDKFDTPHH